MVLPSVPSIICEALGFVYTCRQRFFNVMCKQHRRAALSPSLNGTKTVALTVRVNEPLFALTSTIVSAAL